MRSIQVLERRTLDNDFDIDYALNLAQTSRLLPDRLTLDSFLDHAAAVCHQLDDAL